VSGLPGGGGRLGVLEFSPSTPCPAIEGLPSKDRPRRQTGGILRILWGLFPGLVDVSRPSHVRI
jgi:hypothetical protein